jgi:hypothetical protein
VAAALDRADGSLQHAGVTPACGRRGSDAAQGKSPHWQHLDGGGVDGVDIGVGGIDGEAWTALGQARLGGDLRGKTEER